MDKLTQKAKEIIASIKYITIATASKDGMPWNSPVYFAFDEKYNFYWASDSESRHSQNIYSNNKIAIIIYDSSVPAGQGKGVYFEAKAYEIIDRKEQEKAYMLLAKRDNGYPWTLEELQGSNRPRLYKAITEKAWINVDGEINGLFIDKRTEIKLI